MSRIHKLLLCASTLLAADATLASADAPPVLSHSETILSLGEVRNENDKGITNKYVVRARGRLIGGIDRGDRLLIEWKAAGKTVSSIECNLQGSGGAFSCTGDDAKPLDQYGALQAVFSFVDDSEDTTTPVYTMNLRVGRFWNWYVRGKKTLHYPKYQVVLSDLQGTATVRHVQGGYYETEAGPLDFFMYVAAGNQGWSGDGETLRCSVGGKKLVDTDASIGDTLLAETIDWRGPDAEKHEVHFHRLRFVPSALLWGTSDKIGEDHLKKQIAAGDTILLGDHPGDWSCDLRQKGKVLRTFTFTVGSDGRIAPHAEQAAGLALPPGEVMVGVSFPDDVLDTYFDPAAVKAAGFFGRAWSDSAASVSKVGKAKGPAELAPPKGAKGGTAVKAK
jgi:hypothetical protein